MQKSAWGKTTEGAEAYLYTLSSGELEVRVSSFGAHIVGVRAPDRTGRVQDVVLGFDSLDGYLQPHNGYLGALVGRYANRIAHGQFTLDGNHHEIPLNNGRNAIHGGPVGFDRYVWKAEESGDSVEFTHVSPDGDMGFPGTLTTKVRYTLSGRTLRLDFSAATDKPTILNLTNHVYFNLRGDDDGDILGHILEINSEEYLPADSEQIPTGQISLGEGTPLDFRRPAVLGARINDNFEQLKLAGGYDHSFVVRGKPGDLRFAARAIEPDSGRTLTVATTQPAVHFYSGNMLTGKLTGRHGTVYAPRTGFCLETQHYPDAPHHLNFPSTVLRPGEAFQEATAFTFGVE